MSKFSLFVQLRLFSSFVSFLAFAGSIREHRVASLDIFVLVSFFSWSNAHHFFPSSFTWRCSLLSCSQTCVMSGSESGLQNVKGQVREREEGTAGRENDNNSNKPNQNQLE